MELRSTRTAALLVLWSLAAIVAGFSDAAAAQKAPAPVANSSGKDLKVRIHTTMGLIEAKLFPNEAPKTVSNFVTLARSGFYNGSKFHRVVPKFMVQTGDPKGDGTGGPGYTFADEINPALNHSKAGMLSMVNGEQNANGSQFFITVAPASHLDGRKSIFGQVTSGLDVAIKISEVDTVGTKPKRDVKIDKMEVIGDFTPVEVEKVRELSESEIKSLCQKPAERILKGIGDAQDFGTLLNARFQTFIGRGRMAQVTYLADFDRIKGVSIKILGEVQGNEFKLQDLQFSTGKGL